MPGAPDRGAHPDPDVDRQRDTPLAVQRVGPGAKLASDHAFAAALVTLWHRVSAAGGAVGFSPAAGRPEVAARAAEAVQQVRAGSLLGVAVFRGRALLGVGFLRPGRDLQAHTGTIAWVMVEPGAQRTGIGTLLMGALLSIADERGIDRLDCVVRDGAHLQAYFARFAFAECGRLPGWVRLPRGAGVANGSDDDPAHHLADDPAHDPADGSADGSADESAEERDEVVLVRLARARR